MNRLAVGLVLAAAVLLGQPADAKAKSGNVPVSGLSQTPPACPGDTPVWVNTSSNIAWAPGSKYYGKTKHGGYACAKNAQTMGFRPAKVNSKMENGSPNSAVINGAQGGSSMTTGTAGSDSTMTSGSATRRHHKKSAMTSGVSPAPAATP